MTIYLTILGFLSIFSLLEIFQINIKYRQKIFIYWTIVVILILVAGLRYGLEQDYWHYYNIFTEKYQVSSIELGFKAFNAIIRLFTKDYGVYCLIVAIISMGIKGKIFSKWKYPFVILLCYYLRFYVLFELNVIRQGIAMGFVIFAIYSLKSNNLKKYFVFLGIGFLFHSSSICGLVALILRNKKFKLKHVVFIYLLCVIFRLFLFDSAITSLGKYIPYVISSTNNLIRGTQYIINSGDKMQEMNYFSLARVIIPGVCLYFISDTEDNRLFYNLYFVGSILNLMFWGLDTISFRMPAIFYIFECFMLSNALSSYQLFGRKKKDWVFTICLMCIAFCDVWTFISYLSDSITLVPYKSILFK